MEPIPRAEVAVLDRNAEALGVATRTLMANAGAAVADVVRERAPEGPVVVLCGTGNNGGDGLVAARELAGEREVRVLLAGDPSTQLAREALDALPDAVELHRSTDLDDEGLDEAVAGAGVLLDALLGAGAEGAPRGEVGRMVEAQRGLDVFRVSVDAPTGAGTELPLVPDVTVTLGAAKQLPAGAATGETVVADIGIPERALTHTGPGELELYPRPSVDQHKGQGGFVLVVGGGPYAGAPALAAMGAMRAGADLAAALVPEPAFEAVSGFSPNLIARPLEGENLDLENPANRTTLNKWLGRVDSVVVGPGLGKMGRVEDSVPVAVDRVRDLGLPTVLDADALWALADTGTTFDGNAVLTPHAGEYKRLTGRAPPPANDVDGRAEVARELADRTGATVLLKGPTDVVASAERARRNATGTPAMSHGGTGDVLAGVTAALQAKGLPAFDAARLAAWLNGRAGEQATDEASYGMLATDVVEAIPGVLRAYLGPA